MIKMFLRKRRKKGNKNKSQSSLGPLKELSVVTWRVSITKRWESKSKKIAIFKNKVVWKQQHFCRRWTTSRNERNASVYVWWRKISLAGIFFSVTTPGSPLLDPPGSTWIHTWITFTESTHPSFKSLFEVRRVLGEREDVHPQQGRQENTTRGFQESTRVSLL